MGKKSTVQVNGRLLKAHRKAARFTQESFAAECGSVSPVTVRRAENGNRIMRPYLNRIAQVLGQSADRYAADSGLESQQTPPVSIDGQWTGFFIEDDRNMLPYVVQETIMIRQEKDRFEASYTCYAPHEIRKETVRNGRIVGNVAFGTIIPDDWPLPSGLTNFVQMTSRNNDWLEGFHSWYDPDTDQIETSRLIAVRRASKSYGAYLRDARAIMEKDVPLFQLRKLLEQGYDFADAVAMVQTLPGLPPSRDAAADARPSTRIEGVEYLARTGRSYGDLLKEIIAMDYRYIGNSSEIHEGTAEQWAPIFERHPNCWRLLTKNDRIVGYWHFLALTPEKTRQALAGTLADGTILLDDTRSLDAPGCYSIYLPAIVCMPEFRFGRSFQRLFDALFKVAEEFASKGVMFDQIILAAWTAEAENLAFRIGGCAQVPLKLFEIGPGDFTPRVFAATFRDVLDSGVANTFVELHRAYDTWDG